MAHAEGQGGGRGPEGGGPAGLPRTVQLLGLVSLFTDASSEMIFTLLPAFLAAEVGGAAVLLGAMEGAGELVAALLKVQAGVWADRARRLKPLVLAGYGLSTFARPWMALATAWWHPLLVRVVDRTGKGLRGAPRDALIALAVPRARRGEAYGFHRAMDHAGAAVGALLATVLLAAGLQVRSIFLWAAVPGALAMLALLLVREAPRPPRPPAGTAAGPAAHAPPPDAPLPRALRAFLLPVGLFALARGTDAFLLLLLTAQGAAPATLPLAWLGLHVAKSALSWPAGRLADRLGPERVVLAGWATYALAAGLLAASPSVGATLAVLAVFGLYQALSEGAEKALLAGLVPAEVRGRAFGLYHGVAGAAALAAGLWFGLLWEHVSPSAAWLASGGLALAASAVLLGARRGLRGEGAGGA